MTAKQLLSIGLLASIIVGLGEWCLHFIPEGPTGEVSMLERVPLPRARIGHFLVIIGAPLYFAGYLGLRNLFKSTHETLANLLMITGILAFSIGGAWVSSRYFAAVVFQHSLGTEDFAYYLGQYEDNYQILVWALRILVLLLSGFFVMLVVNNKIQMPKWLALFNPLLLLIISLSMLVWFKPLGVHLAPIAMNTSHFIMFAALLFFVRFDKTNPSNEHT